MIIENNPRIAVRVIYCDTGSEHPDNKRFLADCEQWFERPIEVVRSARYANHWEVLEAGTFLSGHHGAPCTAALKKIPALATIDVGVDIEVIGYTAEETRRIPRLLAANPERLIRFPLVEATITKPDCFLLLAQAGIREPEMYRLGFSNNNCIACVKARDNVDYWLRVKKYFPDEFKRMAGLERRVNFALNRKTVGGERTPIFLDQMKGEPKNQIYQYNAICFVALIRLSLPPHSREPTTGKDPKEPRTIT